MILQVFAWIRFLIALTAMYFFLYEYMFKKYTYQVHLYDELYFKTPETKFKEVKLLFDAHSNPIKAQDFELHHKDRSQSQIGSLSEYDSQEIIMDQNPFSRKIIETQSSVQETLFDSLFVEKVDSYIMDFYNWYRFEFIFTDLGYDSYLEFRIIEIKKGSHQIVQKIPFNLPYNFYPQSVNDTKNKLDIRYQNQNLSLNITQSYIPERYNDPQSDGLENQQLFYLTSAKTEISAEDYQKFGSSKTFTQFNFTFSRKDYEIRANFTFVIRHNQCTTSQQNGKLRHKCMGGYGKGKLGFSQFLRQQQNIKEKKYIGNWERNSFNLDNSRVRTTFIGERTLRKPLGSELKIPKSLEFLRCLNFEQVQTFFTPLQTAHNSVEIDFIGFHKLEYYSKKDKIEKQRWIGMSLYNTLDENGIPIHSNPHENNLFVNGNIHPIYSLTLSEPIFYSDLHEGQIIRFKNTEAEKEGKKSPVFDIEFEVAHLNVYDEMRVWGSKRTYRVDGYWKGWIDEGVLFEDEKQRVHYNQTTEYGYVSFYEIMGTIKFTKQLS